jgi:phosphopantothenoylcysteine decarboxylase/phosphopantothenate--cysteine ligase
MARQTTGKNGPESLTGYEVLLCVTGGIAAYKAADLTSKLVQRGAGVNVALTEAACRFIQPLTFQSLTHRPVYTSLWQSTENYRMGHVSLTEGVDLMVIAPATADILAKLAVGIADDLVSTLGLSACGTCPILAAPAMNTRMWNAPPTQENITVLRRRGVRIVGPAEGNLACGDQGVGRMVEPEEILDTIVDMLREKPPKSNTTAG